MSRLETPIERTMMLVTTRKTFQLISCALLAMGLHMQPTQASEEEMPIFKEIPTQFIAALGDPNATSGTGAQSWGLWRQDPGPRGVWLSLFPVLQATGGHGPGNWEFDDNDWWLDENGLIMEKPEFSLPPGKYLVTGDREVTAMLTVHSADENGEVNWELNKGAKLYDVTHLPCRSARYTPVTSDKLCSPSNAPKSAFRVAPGTSMPQVDGCKKQDYSVLFVVAVAVDS